MGTQGEVQDGQGQQANSHSSSCAWRRRIGIGATDGFRGALSNLGHIVARTTVANILKQHGLEPAPEQSGKTTWKEFLTRHWELIVAPDFFTVEVWTRRGLQRFLVLFFIDLSSRRVKIAGIGAPTACGWAKSLASSPIPSMVCCEAAATFTELERPRRTLCENNQRGVPGPIDSHR